MKIDDIKYVSIKYDNNGNFQPYFSKVSCELMTDNECILHGNRYDITYVDYKDNHGELTICENCFNKIFQ